MENAVENAVEGIINIFERFRQAPTPSDKFQHVGKPKMRDKIQAFVAKQQPVKFTMLGFPFKSQNKRDKVLGDLPDLGEELSLANFGAFADNVKAIYAPGVEFDLVSDGYAFNELFNVPDTTVAAYAEIVRDMSKPFPIKWYDMTTFYQGNMNDNRRKLLEQWAPTPEEMQQRIMTDVNVNYLYRGMLIFMAAETAIWPFDSRSKRERETKALVRQMMIMNEAYSALTRHEFGDHIRLSMHKSDNSGDKYSFQLIPGPHEKIWTSPWHGAVLEDGKDHEMIHVKEARTAGCEVVSKDGRPYYFVPGKAMEAQPFIARKMVENAGH